MPIAYASYIALLNDNVKWMSQSYGNARAIGFRPRPECANFGAALKRIAALFANYDPRARDSWNEYPAAPRLCKQHDVVYISIDEDRLRDTLVNYFEANLPRELGRIVRTPDADGIDDIDFVYDEKEVARIARELAARWMADEIEVQCFLRDEPIISHPEYSLGLSRYQPSAVCA